MKSLITILLLTFINIAHAQSIVCSFTEDEGTRREKTTDVPLENENHHGMNYFDLDTASGFIASSAGHLVVNVVLKENGQVFSMNTLISEYTYLSGTVFTPDNTRLMRITCK